MIDVDEAVQLIREVKRQCELIGVSGKWYLFGSILLKKGAISDIDVLVVSSNTTGHAEIRRLVEELLSDWPIDLIILTGSEELELDFVNIVGAKIVN